ncbi:site-specific integrase [Vibrio hannami]|uniref:tyrosine-type recombinase/integrase n=1 Tax=Vibrio hannami TaxID=2717094 RepID=UPI00240EBF42|nr:site-specific integrase [Vibrio hannami]MDG3084730.1 site-specific integrase [Vibrio hannami]
MASYHIQKVKTQSGITKFKCRVRERQSGVTTVDKTKTFAKKTSAVAWAEQEVEKIESVRHGGVIPTKQTIGFLIEKALKAPEFISKRTMNFNLRLLLRYPIAHVPLVDFKDHDLIQHCQYRKDNDGVLPQTLSVEISNLRSIFKQAKPMWQIAVNDDVFKSAHHTLVFMGLVGKSARRSRRPNELEIQKLITGLKDREKSSGSSIPYSDIFIISVLTCMRIGEVCDIRWVDLNETQLAVKVRDRKDPRKKNGNHQWVPLLGDSWKIIQRQPRNDERIFPYNPRSVTAGFRRVRNKLGIEDLRYHDLRREGASRLFEAGFTIEEVAQVTGHRSLNTLWQVYTELYPNRLKNKPVRPVI